MELSLVYMLLIVVLAVFGFVHKRWNSEEKRYDRIRRRRTSSSRRSFNGTENDEEYVCVCVCVCDFVSMRICRSESPVADSLRLNGSLMVKSMDMDDLKAYNHREMKFTDRYWREIFRRQSVSFLNREQY